MMAIKKIILVTSTISYVTLATRKSGTLFLLVNVVTTVIEAKFDPFYCNIKIELICDKGKCPS